MTTEPLGENEAKTFIKDQVFTVLARIAAIIGIANVLALFGMWYSVTQTARNVAGELAGTTADESSKRFIDSYKREFDVLARNMERRTEELDKEYTDLFQKIGTQQSKVADISEQAEKLNEAVQTFQRGNVDIQKASELLKLINASTNANTVIGVVSGLQTRLDNLQPMALQSHEPKQLGKEYTADFDGFVTASIHIKSKQTSFLGKRGKDTRTLQEVAFASADVDPGTIPCASILFPVRKGEHWQVEMKPPVAVAASQVVWTALK